MWKRPEPGVLDAFPPAKTTISRAIMGQKALSDEGNDVTFIEGFEPGPVRTTPFGSGSNCSDTKTMVIIFIGAQRDGSTGGEL